MTITAARTRPPYSAALTRGDRVKIGEISRGAGDVTSVTVAKEIAVAQHAGDAPEDLWFTFASPAEMTFYVLPAPVREPCRPVTEC